MIDFTECQELSKGYNGSNGIKLSIKYNDKTYMLKFPTRGKQNKNIRYSSSCISEYIGSHIFQTIGIETQNTLLGEYTYDGKTKKSCCM